MRSRLLPNVVSCSKPLCSLKEVLVIASLVEMRNRVILSTETELKITVVRGCQLNFYGNDLKYMLLKRAN